MSLLPAYIELPPARQKKARKVLSEQIGIPLDEGNADVIIEQVWNALLGNPLADEEDD